jgi:mannose-1-phosphate guanylyltransferase
MKAMILAAGLGTRLSPYTEYCPKPLFPILGKPLLLHQLEQLRRYDFGPFVVNAHHLRGHFHHILNNFEDVSLQLEETVLGTGGGLRKALPILGNEPVLVLNGDIIHTYNLSSIIEHHKRSGCPVSLVVHDFPRFNNVRVSKDGIIKGFRQSTDPDKGQDLMAFTGIHVLDPSVLHEIPHDSFFDIIDLYRSLISSGHVDIAAIKVKDGFWTDIGTPADYLNVHRDVLTGSAPQHLKEMFSDIAGPEVIMPDVKVGRDVVIEDWAFVGAGARIGRGVKIARSVIWDGAIVEDGAIIEDKIIVS